MDDKIKEATSFGRPGIRVGRGEDDDDDEDEEDEAGEDTGEGWTMASSTSLLFLSLPFCGWGLVQLLFTFFLHFHSTLLLKSTDFVHVESALDYY